jgi:hypothetical protein
MFTGALPSALAPSEKATDPAGTPPSEVTVAISVTGVPALVVTAEAAMTVEVEAAILAGVVRVFSTTETAELTGSFTTRSGNPSPLRSATAMTVDCVAVKATGSPNPP